MTMTLISTVTVGAGGASSIDFNSIPQTYTDLHIILSARTAYSSVFQYVTVGLNGTGTTSAKNLLGNGGSVSSNSNNQVDGAIPAATSTALTFSNVQLYIPNYTSSTSKVISVDGVGENNSTTAYQALTALLSSTTSAVTSLSLGFAGQSAVQYSTASLYGITKGSGGATVA